MKETLWVLHLPKRAKLLVKKGDKISLGDQLARTKKRVFKSPAKGEVVEADKGKIKLQFKTEKVSGKGITGQRCWGKLAFLPELDFVNLSIDQKGRIIFINNVNRLLLTKAAALGIGGVICCHLNEELEEELIPLLIVDESDQIKLMIERAEGVKCLLDPANSCFLIPK